FIQQHLAVAHNNVCVVISAFVIIGEALVITPFDRLITGKSLVEVRRCNNGHAIFGAVVVPRTYGLLQSTIPILYFLYKRSGFVIRIAGKWRTIQIEVSIYKVTGKTRSVAVCRADEASVC